MKYLSLVFLLVLVGCTNEPLAREKLRSEGYTKVQFTGYSPFSCLKNMTSTGFQATNSHGVVEKGTVCCFQLFSACFISHL